MKEIYWLGSSYKALLEFSKDAKKEAGYQLDKVQRGLEPSDWKPIIGAGRGVKEIRIHQENEYRVIYVANVGEVIYVLHAFCKKTQKTSKKELEIVKKRFNEINKTRNQS